MSDFGADGGVEAARERRRGGARLKSKRKLSKGNSEKEEKWQ